MSASKYDPLKNYLKNQSVERVPMKFEDIERLLGFDLPKSSRNHRAWWSNNPSNSVITHAWLNAGYETSDVDMAGERLTFRKAKAPPMTPVSKPGGLTTPAGGADAKTRKRNPLFGALKGMLTFHPGVDLTEPADAEWGKVYDNE